MEDEVGSVVPRKGIKEKIVHQLVRLTFIGELPNSMEGASHDYHEDVIRGYRDI